MAQIDTTNLDAGTDKIKLARPALLAIAQFINKLLGYTTDDITATEKTAFRNVLDVPTKGGSGASGNWGVNAATATKLATPRAIGGVNFDGSANIDLPGVNTAGNQSTSGNAATSTTAGTAGSAASLTGTTTAAIQTSALGSGTASATTFLAGDRTFKAINLTPTTADVLAATAAAAVGDVGSYAFMTMGTNQVTTSPGGTVAGSSLRYASSGSSDPWITQSATPTPAGTWRLMGYFWASSKTASLWLRIS